MHDWLSFFDKIDAATSSRGDPLVIEYKYCLKMFP